MRISRVGRPAVVGVLVLAAATGCGQREGGADASPAPLTLPTGPTTWDAGAPAWLLDGTLHVGDRTVVLGPEADGFVLGATGVYWSGSGRRLRFTDVEGRTREVPDLEPRDLAVSADHTVLAAVDGSRGPTDSYGTHVMQAVVFDTRTGEQLYRTPDAEPDDGDDLADLYEETTPLLRGVSAERLFFDGTTVDLATGRSTPSTQDAEGGEVYPGYADTLFLDGYRVDLEGEGDTRRVTTSADVVATGRLSPDRSLVLDIATAPGPAVVYDAATGEQRRLDGPWEHFELNGFTDADTFFGVAEQVGAGDDEGSVLAAQVVTCESATLVCTPVGEVVDLSGDEHGTGPISEVGLDRF